jgi:ATP-dependent DNA helicase HFM1/MER3
MKLNGVARLLAASATAPNIDDVARWLGQREFQGTGLRHNRVACETPAISLIFGEEYRPVALKKVCLGYPQSIDESDFQFDQKLNNVYPPFGAVH